MYMIMQLIGEVPSSELRPGMRISKDPTISTRNTEVVGDFTGMCEHGLHFGTSCYDFISHWCVYEFA